MLCAECTTDADCAPFPDTYCHSGSTGICEQTKGLAQACARDGECQSNACPEDDFICCDQACTELCMGCTEAKTGAPSGTCAPIKASTDPDDDFATLLVCNGMGACL
jgi:hypothetical protein